MTRKELEELGLSKEQIDSIMQINGVDIENAKKTLNTTISNLETENKALKGQVKERDKQIEDIKNSTGNIETLKNTIATLQSENKKNVEKHITEMKQLKLDVAIETALTNAKAKNKLAVKALLKDMDKAEILEDGTIKGLDEQIKALMKAEDSKFLFETEEKGATFKGVNPASGSGVPKTITKEEFSKMGYKEQVALFNENKELYNSLVE